VLSNIKFVVSMANRYKNAGVSLSDLINQGNLGLIEAARRFDPEKGVKFIPMLLVDKAGMVQLLAEQSGTVKLPIKQASLLYKINESDRKIFQKSFIESQCLKKWPNTSRLIKTL